MLITALSIDDFKTERKDLMPPLPVVYRIVPIVFYGSIVFLVVVGALAIWHVRVAEGRRNEVESRVSGLKKEIESAKASRSSLEMEIREATDLEGWVLASMPVQPLIVTIIRSMSPTTAIVDLSLERDPETPSQLKLALTMNTDSDKQIEQTLERIRALNYREFSPTQSMVKGNLEYKASLLWRNPSKESPSPESRAKEITSP